MSTTRLATHAAALLALGRPLHLGGGAIFYGLGVAAAGYGGVPLAPSTALLGLLTVMAAQLMNHYSNDYFDLDADQANSTPTRWSGGSRVLLAGQLPHQAALWAALGCGAVALLLAGAAAVSAPAPLSSAALLISAIALAWVYSGPPLYLHRRGLGELVGAVVVPGLSAMVGYQLQVGALGSLILLTITPLCLMQFAMLVAVSLPDVVGDAAVGKLTLAVLLGPQRAAWLLATALVLAYALLPVLWWLGLPILVALAPLGAAPIAAWLSLQVARGAWAQPAAWEGLGFWSIGQLVASAGLMLLAFLMR